VTVIQKFIRGHWGRQDFEKVKRRRLKEIGDHHDRYQNEFEKNKEYDIERYLKEKKKIRQQTGFDNYDDITEEIGESIGSSN
jgi:hypothetical protein